MPDNFEPPPWAGKGFTEKARKLFLNPLSQWLLDHRIVAVQGGFLTDAPGGGKQIEVNPPLGVSDSVAQGFTLISAPENKVRVTVSLLAGDLPSGFNPDDDPPFLLTVSDGDYIYCKVQWDVTTGFVGLITTRTVNHYSGVQTDDQENGIFYYLLGTIAVSDGAVTPTQYRFGPIETEIVRVWFLTPPTFLVSGQ